MGFLQYVGEDFDSGVGQEGQVLGLRQFVNQSTHGVTKLAYL
jgi:hypothetical protein